MTIVLIGENDNAIMWARDAIDDINAVESGAPEYILFAEDYIHRFYRVKSHHHNWDHILVRLTRRWHILKWGKALKCLVVRIIAT